MANKDKLKQLLNNRNPLEVKREAVTPVNLYQETTESTQVDKTTSTQNRKGTSKQMGKDTNNQVVKYTTHLTPETIKAIKQRALDTDKKDYEVVADALSEYLKGGTPHK